MLKRYRSIQYILSQRYDCSPDSLSSYPESISSCRFHLSRYRALSPSQTQKPHPYIRHRRSNAGDLRTLAISTKQNHIHPRTQTHTQAKRAAHQHCMCRHKHLNDGVASSPAGTEVPACTRKGARVVGKTAQQARHQPKKAPPLQRKPQNPNKKSPTKR